MGKPPPVELRRRVVDFVDEGHSHRAAARHFRVSPRFVNDLIVLRRETGSLEPKRQGNRGHNGKYQGVEVWLRSRVSECGELTLDELRVELERECGITVHRATVCDWLHRFGLSHKKMYGPPPVRKRFRVDGLKRSASMYPALSRSPVLLAMMGIRASRSS